MRGKRSVFYFDDDAMCLTLFSEMFGADYEVRAAAKLAEARRMLAERPAEIVISDQRMPEIDGTDFLREVSELYPASFRVLLTGSVTVGEVLHEIGAGVVNLFVTKPWTREEMRHMIERAGASLEAGGISE